MRSMGTAEGMECLENEPCRHSRSDHLKNRILSYLQENYSDPELYGKAVAAKFGINEKYLYTFFKEQTGSSFAAYLERLRLNQAVVLIESGRFFLGEIACMVGFNSSNTFYKAFRRVYGTSPSVYREKAKVRQSEGSGDNGL